MQPGVQLIQRSRNEILSHVDFLDRVHSRAIGGHAIVIDGTLTNNRGVAFRDLLLARKFGFQHFLPFVGRPSFKPVPPKILCACFEPDARYTEFEKETVHIGTDPTRGRFGDTQVRTCASCARLWVHYQVEYEGYSASGRWFRTLIPADAVPLLNPFSSVAFIENSPWFFYGGSAYDSTGKVGYYAVGADLTGHTY
ncbi:MAG: hypothetical protein JNM27_03260 [Leptospirales bacterium]|nr:hypothetical protein [Leptospirales bacterium]